MNPPPSRRVHMIALYLDGLASQWFLSLYKTDPHVLEWDHFQSLILAKFGHAQSPFVLRDQLYKLRQGSNIEEYVDAFSNIVSKLPEMHDYDRLFYFQMGLKPRVQNHLRIQQFTSLDSAITEAIRYDSAIVSTSRPFAPNRFSVPRPRDSSAMDVDAVHSLSATEKEYRMRNGLCFYCGKHGHLARLCPEKGRKVNVVSGNDIGPVQTERTVGLATDNQ